MCYNFEVVLILRWSLSKVPKYTLEATKHEIEGTVSKFHIYLFNIKIEVEN